MRKKILLILSLVIILTLSVLLVGCEGGSVKTYKDGIFEFALNKDMGIDEEGYCVNIKLDETSQKEVVVPATFRGEPVTWISGVEGKEYLTSLVVSEGVKHISTIGFSNSKNLKSVILPSTMVEIGANAFNLCESLESINIPKNVVKMDGAPFVGCGEDLIIYLEFSKDEIPSTWNADWNLKSNENNNKIYHSVTFEI